MKVASFNVNSINARLPRILAWIDDAKPDVCVFQELKCVDEKFPVEEFEGRGYNVAVHGQKTYNGVALISKAPMDDIRRGLPDFDDDQSRFIEAVIMPNDAAPFRVAGLYLPNGNPAPGEKYTYKLHWMAALECRMADVLAMEEASLFLGDYNVIPEPSGVYDPQGWAEDALFRLETRTAFRRLLNMGYTDAIPHFVPLPFYTFWDYQGGAWDRNHGLRIDHALLTPQACDRLTGAGVDRAVREPNVGPRDAKPSDHVPVWVEIS